ncbi:MAG: MATE family efflux transporter [Chlorobi bacterium]|nr:MATE family efflux transporter [Chlorobiota bacterium]
MNKQILRLAIPNILSNITVPLLSSVDTAIVGHLDKVAYIGAIAVGSVMFNFIYWGFGFLRMGTTGLTAQSYGGKNREEIISVLLRALFVAALVSAALILLRQAIAGIGFYLIDAPAEVTVLAEEYFFIRIFAAPAALSLYAFYGWFFGMQDAKTPLLISLVVNSVNITLDYLFVYHYGMKSDGVALGTVIAQYLGLFLAVVIFFAKYKSYLVAVPFKKIFDAVKLEKFFTVNFDIFIRTICLVFTFSFFIAESGTFGEDILAANSILIQLWLLLSYGIDGFAFAAESLVGKYYGMRNRTKFIAAVKYSFAWGIGLGFFYSLVYILFGNEIVSLFTSNEKVVLIAMSFFGWTIIAPVINSWSFIWDGVYLGSTMTKQMRNSMLISTIAVFLPLYFLTRESLGNNSLWLAMTIFMFARGITLTLTAKKNIFNFLKT